MPGCACGCGRESVIDGVVITCHCGREYEVDSAKRLICSCGAVLVDTGTPCPTCNHRVPYTNATERNRAWRARKKEARDA